MKKSKNQCLLSLGLKASLLVTLMGLACSKPRPAGHQADPHAGHDMAASHQPIRGDTLHLAPRQEQLSAMQLDTAVRKALGQQDNLLGVAAVDEETVTLVSARVKGRLEKLLVRNPGTLVRKGQPAYRIYSEDLLVQVQEYRLAWQQAAIPGADPKLSRQLLAGARARLLRWGLSPAQVDQALRQEEPSPSLTFYSPATGYLADLMIREGQYVDIGTGLFQLADLRNLWVETQLYASEAGNLGKQPQVSLHFEAYPARIYPAYLVSDNPGLEENQKISLVRFRIANADLKIKPGMMAYVHLDPKSRQTIVVPKTCLVTGNLKFLWVKTAPGLYERRSVQTGLETKQEAEILSGIDPGEVVVSSGGYLLSGELTLRRGGQPAHVHEH